MSQKCSKARSNSPTVCLFRKGLALPKTLLGQIVVGISIALMFALGFSTPASAHAGLVSTTPGDGSELATSPRAITLVFSENVGVTLGGVRVLDREGNRVDSGETQALGAEIRAGLKPLESGSYIVAWRVVSADSHPIDGSFTFTVGKGNKQIDDSLAESLLGENGESTYTLAGVFARILGYGGSLTAIGLATFLAFAFDGGPERKQLKRGIQGLVAIGMVGLTAELPIRAALATGLGLNAVFEPEVLEQVLGNNVGLGLLLSLLSLVFVAFDGGRDKLIAGLTPLTFGLAVGIAGHTSTTPPVGLSVAADLAHVAAASVWLGGLLGCLYLIAQRRKSELSSIGVIVRFSTIAGIALGGVALGGSILGWTEVRTVNALLTTAYGQLLMIKVAAVAIVAFLGGVNRFRVLPLLESRADSSAAVPVETTKAAHSVLRTTLIAEAAILAVVIVVTAVLVDVIPARTAVATPFKKVETIADGNKIDLYVDPAKAGPTTIHVYLTEPSGQPIDLPEGIELRFSLPSAAIANLERRPDATGPGHWTLIGNTMSIPGAWQITVAARLDLYDEQTAIFEVEIRS